MRLNVLLKDKIGFLLAGCISVVLFVGCSTGKNTTVTRAYHELTTRYNIYYNAEKAYNDILQNQYLRFSDNYSELLPFYPHTQQNEKTLPGGPFDVVVEKTSKAIREHSITAKPRRDPAQRQTEAFRRWLQQEEFNPFIQKAWLLLGKAHLQNRDYEQALAVFTHMQRIYKNETGLLHEVQIWMLRTYTETGRMYDAENMLHLLGSRTVSESLNTLFTETYTHYLFQKGAYSEAIPWLNKVINQEVHSGQKRRLRYLLGQAYAIVGEKEKAFHAFEEVKGLSTPHLLTLHATISQLAVAPEAAQPAIRRALAKMRSKTVSESDLVRMQFALDPNLSDSLSSLQQLAQDKTAALTVSFAGDSTLLIAQKHDSLYQKAYRAWQEGDTTTVRSAWEVFHELYPRSGLLPQFLLLHALSYAQSGDAAETERNLSQLLERFPESEAAPLARNIIAGLSQGRRLTNNTSLQSQWGSYPTAHVDAQGHPGEISPFSTVRDGPHLLLLTFEADSPFKNRILFSTANFSFSRFRHRTFEFSFITIPGGEALIVQPFQSYDEASRYILMMQSDSLFTAQIPYEVIPFIISEENLTILQGRGTMDAYRVFSIENFGEATATVLSAVNAVVDDSGENIPQKSENMLSLEAKKRPETGKSANTAPPLVVEEKHNTAAKSHIAPLTEERRITPEELQRQLEQKAAAALQEKKERTSLRSRESLLKERERERQEKIRQRERELKERTQRRETELKQRERERALKIREQGKRRKEKQREQERTRTQ
jgi:outer membrane protein assembly factor BamD (BamD/ComL family)